MSAGKYDAYYNAVSEICECLRRDLIGPVKELEILENVWPLNTYVCGILWPLRLNSLSNDTDEHEEALLSAKQDDNEEMEDAVAAADDSISNANVLKPTSMGISVMLPILETRLGITFSFAKYFYEEDIRIDKRALTNNAKDQNEDITIIDEETEMKVKNYKFKRKPFTVQFELKAGRQIGSKQIAINKDLGFELILTIRNVSDSGKLVTITAQNITRARKNNIEQSASSLFQCELSILSASAFLPIYQNNTAINNIEELINHLQYRNIVNYAYGHGCSTNYTESRNGVFVINSDFLPIERVYQMMPGEIRNANILNLAYLKMTPTDTVCAELSCFVDEYAAWYRSQRKVADMLTASDYKFASDKILERIEMCITRLRHGISTLKNNNAAWNAFNLMNQAMLLQRIKTKHINENDVFWYPFQIAYILQIIPDIVNDDSIYRKSVDLLWFPTGGGKTEAYLGIAAFTIFYRRLIGESAADGVTVIMRYTLRLLTIQQFERAAALVCALEHIRKKEKLSGGEISIGLWIGSGMTPNRILQAKEVLTKLKENPYEKIYECNPVQITKCPWCGSKIDLSGYEIRNNALNICCADNPSCEFHKSLPIYVVDDDIYRVRPTILLSTIDKFARIAWEKNARNLFGYQCLPPELIIQDELHLISGPLGSLTGIYEIALDYLCGKNGKLPKIIASTATIKNAKAQIQNLYNRQTIQFPPAGINYDDSFFAIIADANKRPARTYIGLCEIGGSIADLLIRVYATLFFAKALFIKSGKNTDIIDQYFTTVGYFNALKDLGASSTIIQDRIYSHIRNLVARTFKNESEQYQITPKDVKVFEHSELTSRKSSKEIKDTLDQLALSYNEPGCFSYVLASNMLSVGIDIDRLGVMAVYNQPKSNAEYIQSTSRVGRRNPGIVLTMYNNMRSRDKSHYEQFGYYHKSFYCYVEAASVTPFSLRAMEKALHCIFIALVRLTIPFLSSNEAARDFRDNTAEVNKIRDYIVRRVSEITPKHKEFALKMLLDVARDWEGIAITNNNTLCYKSYTGGLSLLNSAEDDSELDFPKILNSLRNVDPSTNIYFTR